jgi:urease accessory protein
MRLHHDWLIWQIADSAFPTGGFAHSCGLEAAWQHGEVRGRAELIGFAQANLQQLGRGALPFMQAAFREPMRLTELDEHFDAFTPNHVANRASRLQGKSFWLAAARSFPSAAIEELRPQAEAENFCGHLPPVFGAIVSILGLKQEDAINLFFFLQLRSLLASAVRLGIIGPMESQAIQYKLSATAQSVALACTDIPLEEAAQTAPLLDLWQGAQDRLYSRLFQS